MAHGYSKLRDADPLPITPSAKDSAWARRNPHRRDFYMPDTPEGREAWLSEIREWEKSQTGPVLRRTRHPIDPLDRIRPKES